MSRSLASLLVVALAGCPAAPVTYSAPVEIQLHAMSQDALNGVVTDDKAISAEHGNPYGAFVTEAKAQLAGRSPSAIVVEGASLALGSGSTNVSSFSEVFGGAVTVLFVIDESNNSYQVASSLDEAPAGALLELDPHFDSAALTEFDYYKLLAGKFHVVARGAAARGFADKGARGDLELKLTFSAFE